MASYELKSNQYIDLHEYKLPANALIRMAKDQTKQLQLNNNKNSDVNYLHPLKVLQNHLVQIKKSQLSNEIDIIIFFFNNAYHDMNLFLSHHQHIVALMIIEHFVHDKHYYTDQVQRHQLQLSI